MSRSRVSSCRPCDRRTLHRYTPIFEQDFKEQIFSHFYESDSMAEQNPIEAHKLALLFFVLAMGKLTNPRTRDLSTQEAMKYFHIGKAALTLNQSLETPSIPLLQGLLIMCHFMFWANIESSRWLAMGIVVKLSQSVRAPPTLSLFDVECVHYRLDCVSSSTSPVYTKGLSR